MNKTLISHFFNEEYLLPWWCEYHKKIFDQALLINYNSTDRSVEIIKDICPKWQIVNSINHEFDAQKIDFEVMSYESKFEGWKASLNTTEFLVGDFSLLDDQVDKTIFVPSTVMVDVEPNTKPTYDKPLIQQKQFGIRYDEIDSTIRRPRCIHNKHSYQYTIGRHEDSYTTTNLHILWYGWSPFNEQQIKRKLQIQTRIPDSDKMRGLGTQHITNEQKLLNDYNNYFVPRARKIDYV
jgi:hypothetical protein